MPLLVKYTDIPQTKQFLCIFNHPIYYINLFLQTMETRPVVPDRKLLARLVLIREEARNMMGGGILDERNDRGLNTLPESEVCILNLGYLESNYRTAR